jgi:predicted amidohydrolase YtcJ
MIVLNHNLFKRSATTATDIHETQVQKTNFKGEVVYEP